MKAEQLGTEPGVSADPFAPRHPHESTAEANAPETTNASPGDDAFAGMVGSGDLDARGLRALGTLRDLERDLLALFEGPVARCLDR